MKTRKLKESSRFSSCLHQVLFRRNNSMLRQVWGPSCSFDFLGHTSAQPLIPSFFVSNLVIKFSFLVNRELKRGGRSPTLPFHPVTQSSRGEIKGDKRNALHVMIYSVYKEASWEAEIAVK